MAYEQVSIRIGNENYVANNAATESTLLDLVSVIKQTIGINSSKANNVGFAFDALSRTVDRTNRSTGNYSNSIQKANRHVNSLTNDLSSFGKLVSVTGKSLVALSAGHSSASSILSQFGGIAATQLSSLGNSALATSLILKNKWGKLLGGVGVGLDAAGQLLGGAIQGASAALDLIDNFANSFYRLSDSGILVDDSFQSIIDSAAASSMTLDDLSRFVEQNKTSLLSFGGSISSATKTIFKFRQGVTAANLDQRFINLGIQLEDIPGYIADFGAQTRGAFKNMDLTTVAKSTESLAKSQRLLTDLTGKSVDELRNEAQTRAMATQVQYKLMQLQQSDPEAYAKYSSTAQVILSQFGEAGLAAFQDYFVNNGFTSQATALFADQITSSVAIFSEAKRAIENNTLSVDDVTKVTIVAFRDRVNETSASLEKLASILQPLPALEGPLGQFSDGLGQMVVSMQALSGMTDAEFKNTLEQAKKAADNNDKMITSIGNVGIAMIGLKTSAQALTSELVTLVGDPASNVFKSLAAAIEESINAIKKSIAYVNDPAKVWTDVAGDLVGALIPNMSTPAEVAGSVTGGFLGSSFGPAGTYAGATIGGEVGTLYDNLTASLASWINSLTSTSGPVGVTGGGFATGGISTGPKTGHLEMLHGTEAVVPLPDGKSIPVTSKSLDTKAISDLISLTAKNNEIMSTLTSLTKESLSQLERSNRLLQQSIYVSS